MSLEKFSELIDRTEALGIWLRAKDGQFVVAVNDKSFTYDSLEEIEAFITGFIARAS